MFDEFREKLIGIVTSRLTVFTLLFGLLAGILVYRCFDLQIVHGQQYLEEFVLEIEHGRVQQQRHHNGVPAICLPIMNWHIP